MVVAQIKILMLLLVFLSGCDFNPFNPGESTERFLGGAIIESQKTPHGTMKNFELAYEYRDSLLYEGVLDSQFIFLSTDYNETVPQAILWGREEDLRITNRMFRSFRQIDLNWDNELEFKFSPDSAGVDIRRIFTLTLDGGVEIPPIRGDGLFFLVRNSDDLWRIRKWEDKASF